MSQQSIRNREIIISIIEDTRKHAIINCYYPPPPPQQKKILTRELSKHNL